MHAIIPGDCLETMRAMPDASVDAVVTDPPYGLGKQPDPIELLRDWLGGDDMRRHAAARLQTLGWLRREIEPQPNANELWSDISATLFPPDAYAPGGGGFMGKAWDSIVPGPAAWREVFRVLKPGGHAVVFGGTRTFDLLVLALRIAGFEIRDQLAWMYGSGFPKPKNVAMSIDKGVADNSGDRGPDLSVGAYQPEPGTPGYPWAGWGTNLKPAYEPIALVRKPLAGTVAATVLEFGTGAINVDGCRIPGSKPVTTRGGQGLFFAGLRAQGRIEDDGLGRWPANVLLDEDAAAVLDSQTGISKAGVQRQPKGRGGIWSTEKGQATAGPQYGDSGGASRFFYCSKASKREREAGLEHFPKRTGGELTDREDGSAGTQSPSAGAGRGGGRANHHPTVKPIDVMRWLVRLITPPNGLVLDPFAGSGTTGIAAALEGFWFIGCEQDPEYCEIAKARVKHWTTSQR